MNKYVIETVQNIKRTYYVEVDDPEWAADAITMGELQEYAQQHLTEDFISTRKVDNWGPIENCTSKSVGVNGATYRYNYETNDWEQFVIWDFDNTETEDPLFL